jgi:hypothetical protein
VRLLLTDDDGNTFAALVEFEDDQWPYLVAGEAIRVYPGAMGRPRQVRAQELLVLLEELRVAQVPPGLRAARPIAYGHRWHATTSTAPPGAFAQALCGVRTVEVIGEPLSPAALAQTVTCERCTGLIRAVER